MYRTSSHDLFADAFFILNDRLMFASLYGRDANVLSLLAVLNNNGVSGTERLGFREADSAAGAYPPFSTARYFTGLYKHMTKIHTQNYGVLIHAFVYADEVIRHDLDGKTAWLISDDTDTELTDGIWQTVNRLTDVPLLDGWADRILPRLREQGCIRCYPPGISAEATLVGIQACHIRIPDDFDQQVGR
ncbi:hypothetical protein ACFPVS_02635 [Neisseria weixii]|uniref:hypothetical protein n=2 Tax=Neisseria weixii TaxID=1853276 RepID=UPI0036118972